MATVDIRGQVVMFDDSDRQLFDAIDRLHDLIRIKENLPDLLEYVEHDSWRCGYYDKCHCGLNDLTDKLGLERVPLPVKGEKT